MKKISKFKKFVIAIMCGVAGLAGAASVTGTYAWFVASNTVNVSGLSIKAQAEEGIVMANETHTADAHWGNIITASHNGKDGESNDLAYVPTSTADCASWYHANSNNVDAETAATPYETLTVTAPTEVSGFGNGVVAAPNTSNILGKNVYYLNKFYLQASAKADMEHQDIFLTDLQVTEAGTAQDLNKALRIGVKYDTEAVKILNANGTTTTTYAVNGVANAVTLVAKPVEATESSHIKLINDTTIKAYTTAGTNAKPVYVYMWFEGEDANCKSANIENLMNSLTVTFKIANKAHSA